MSLLDDAKRLEDAFEDTGLALQGGYPHRACRVCKQRGILTDDIFVKQHTAECPVPRLPRIVAALEAAERLAAFDPLDCGDGDEEPCVICGEIIGLWRGERDAQDEKVYVPVPHSPDCRWQALVDALKGDVVP